MTDILDGVTINPGTGGARVAVDTVPDGTTGNVSPEIVKVLLGGPGVNGGLISTTNPLPVTVPSSVAVTGTFWQATQPVSVAAAVTVKQAASTATGSNVSASATSVTILAGNSARLGATIYNDATQNLMLKFGTTASSTDFAIKISGGGYYEVPFGYTGRIDGIWDSAGSGAARVVELT